MAIRIFRSSKLQNSDYAPEGCGKSAVYRYDGLYIVEECRRHNGERVVCNGDTAQSLIPTTDSAKYIFSLKRCNKHSNISNRTYRRKIADTIPSRAVSDQDEMRAAFNQQQRKRAKNQFTPYERSKRKKPIVPDYLVENKEQLIKQASCPISVKRKLPALFKEAMDRLGVKGPSPSPIKVLSDIRFPEYVRPDSEALRVAHDTIRDFMPEEDMECFASSALAREYCIEWRPEQCKVILLAESHAHTSHELVVDGPMLAPEFLEEYKGPRRHLGHVNCFTYGENGCATEDIPINSGTPQFWTLLAACALGPTQSKEMILKTGNTDIKSRLKNKYSVLCKLRSRGIWLVDACVFGWYISQNSKFHRSENSGEVCKKEKERPPSNLKDVSLVASWELYTKHLIREAAAEGHLKAIIPIGKSVVNAISFPRLNEVIDVPGCNAKIERIPPAPNAWVEGGYEQVLEKLCLTLNKYLD